MLTPESIAKYQRTSNAAAGYCAACTKQLQPDEIHVCDSCAVEYAIEADPNFSMREENNG